MILSIAQTVIVAYVSHIILNLEWVPLLTIFNLIVGKLVISLVILFLSFCLTRKLFNIRKIRDVSNKAILITGCDTGFGHNLAIRLDERGFLVFAGCLFPDGPGANELKKLCSKRLHVLELDVTKNSHVEQALEFVQTNLATSKLWAVVNNAGIARGLSVELAELDELQACMDVKAFGLIRVIKAFLPLLRRTKGRVINVASPAGRSGVPYLAPYCVSKHAAVGINDCLRQEMEPWGVKVICIEPEGFNTEMAKLENFHKIVDYSASRVNARIRSDYGEDFLKNIWRFNETPEVSEKIFKVVDDIESAVTDAYPDAIYRPSRNEFTRFFLNLYLSLPMTWQHSVTKFIMWKSGFSKNYPVKNAKFDK